MGPPNLYKMVKHNPCTTKSSLYKMGLVQMDPSNNNSLYKMVGAKAIFQTPKINKMLDL